VNVGGLSVVRHVEEEAVRTGSKDGGQGDPEAA
jgi:hypothetical protein